MAGHLRLVVDNTDHPVHETASTRRDDVLHSIGIDALPFRCGVGTTGFANWAAPRNAGGRRALDVSLVDVEPSRLLITFCGDCDPVFRARAEIAGTCTLADLMAGAMTSLEQERAA